MEGGKHLQQIVLAQWMMVFRRLQIDPCLLSCTKLKSKWIKDLKINPSTLNLIEDKVRSTLECLSTGDYFLNRTPVAQTLRATINKWDLLKLKSFCKAATDWEKIFTNPTSDRGLISKIDKELKLVTKTPKNSIKKWGYRTK